MNVNNPAATGTLTRSGFRYELSFTNLAAIDQIVQIFVNLKGFSSNSGAALVKTFLTFCSPSPGLSLIPALASAPLSFAIDPPSVANKNLSAKFTLTANSTEIIHFYYFGESNASSPGIAAIVHSDAGRQSMYSTNTINIGIEVLNPRGAIIASVGAQLIREKRLPDCAGGTLANAHSGRYLNFRGLQSPVLFNGGRPF